MPNDTKALALVQHDVALATPTSDADFARLTRIANLLAKSGLGGRCDAAATATKIMLGASMGLHPVEAATNLHIINGALALSAKCMAAQLARGGVTWTVEANTDERCVIVFHRAGWPDRRVEWSIEDAKRAGLAGKDNWKHYPRALLFARAISEGARGIGMDLLHGAAYVPEELGAEEDATGRVIAVPAEEPPQIIDLAPEASDESGARPDVMPAEAPPGAETLREPVRLALEALGRITTRAHLIGHVRKHRPEWRALNAEEQEFVRDALADRCEALDMNVGAVLSSATNDLPAREPGSEDA